MATDEEAAERAALGPMDLAGEEVVFEVIEDALTGTFAALREVRSRLDARALARNARAPPPPSPRRRQSRRRRRARTRAFPPP